MEDYHPFLTRQPTINQSYWDIVIMFSNLASLNQGLSTINVAFLVGKSEDFSLQSLQQ
jgi:hypothetical protein